MGRIDRSRTPPGGAELDDSQFPLVVTALSTAAALLLFFSTTVRALGEHRHLQRTAIERADRADAERAVLEAETLNRVALQNDPQAILVELDRRGISLPQLQAAEPVQPADDR